MNPRFADDAFDQNKRLVDALTSIAASRNCTPAQLALAWLLDQGQDIVPIPGTRRIERLDENAAAVQLQLTDTERAQIGAVIARIPVVGTRYPAAGMASINL